MALVDLTIESLENTFAPRLVVFGDGESDTGETKRSTSPVSFGPMTVKRLLGVVFLSIGMATLVWLLRRRGRHED
ncbi:MAG: hypothetical protein ABEJ58_01660 [Halodesulfurarchaeum sp.]